MTAPDRFLRAKTIFFDALDVDPDRRATLVNEACGADAELREAVEALLSRHDDNEADAWDPTSVVQAVVEDDDSLVGATLADRYEVGNELGRGGMGRVYLATDRRFSRPVALKALTFTSEGLRRAFAREARLLNALRHPSLPVVIDYFAERRWHLLVMDYVPGDDLGRALATRLETGAGPFPVVDVVRWTAGLLDVLEYLHGYEPAVVHRDIKPQNLKLTAKGDVVLLDFGLAKGAVGGTVTNATASVAGYTPNYAPLEQIQGTGTDARSDLYALGATVYHLLTGHLPPDACVRAEAVLDGRRDPLAPAHERNPAVPRPLAALVRTAMAITREDRHASASTMRAALATAIRPTIEIAPLGPAERTNNLPRDATSFVGRRRDVAAIAQASAATRLVTLLGPGGIGKTRLALKVAADVLDDFPHGVWLAELAGVAGLADPSLVSGAVATVLGVRPQPGVPALDAVVDALRDRQLLLVLDNGEHVREGCAAVVGAVLDGCPGVRVLATSRQALGVPGERVWPVQPLSLPDPDAPADAVSDAVALFVDRASLAKPSFSSDADVGLVARICRRLEGIPLSIELAAARVRVLSLEQIDARLEDRFRLLTGGDAGVAARQQTLRATVDWSYGLLEGSERAVLRRLSLFPAGCALDAAESVCADADLPADAVLDIVARLVDRSLVSADERDGGVRYRLLETIREYGREQLENAGEERGAFARLSAWATALAAAAAAELVGPSQRTWIARIEEEYDNLRAALDGGPAAGVPDAKCLVLANHLTAFWHVGGRMTDGCALLERTLATCPDAPAIERADAHKGLGTLANALGGYRLAREQYEAGLALAREAGDLLRQGRLLNNLAFTAHKRGEHEESERLFEEGLAIFRETGHKPLVALALNNLATLLNDCGKAERAMPHYEESLAIRRTLGDGIGVSNVLYNLAIVAEGRGDTTRSRSLLEESLALRRGAGEKQGIATTLGRLARVDIADGDVARAAALLAEAIGLQHKLGDRLGVAESLEATVFLAAHEEQWERALRLGGAAAQLREAIGAVRPPSDVAALDRWLAPARAELGDERADRLIAEGHALAIEEALRMAIDGQRS